MLLQNCNIPVLKSTKRDFFHMWYSQILVFQQNLFFVDEVMDIAVLRSIEIPDVLIRSFLDWRSAGYSFQEAIEHLYNIYCGDHLPDDSPLSRLFDFRKI